MAKRVSVLGPTGETGASIMHGLLEQPDLFDIEVLVRPSTKESPPPAILEMEARGVTIRGVDIGSVDELVKVLSGIDVFISAIDALSQLAQLNMATAAKKAGVKRFVPCAWTIVVPPGGIMGMRDEKEEVYQHVRKLYLPYTIIDVGYWYQISFPILPSGRVDYASIFASNNDIYGDGTMPTMLTDLRDIGRFVARIIRDPRTLNRFVFTYGDVLSQNELFALMEDVSGEKIERNHISADELIASRARYTAAIAADPKDLKARVLRLGEDYRYSKYVRGDNTPAYGEYLGYLDARTLYPNFLPRTFKDFVGDLLAGKVSPTYATRVEGIRKLGLNVK
ncbi:hypothetical protein B0H11DRAFT_2175167 [Mycena galericulata]|nr:hypothetical protein B0H11DRAFT_2175167 [Mycena galericulata]